MCRNQLIRARNIDISELPGGKMSGVLATKHNIDDNNNGNTISAVNWKSVYVVDVTRLT